MARPLQPRAVARPLAARRFGPLGDSASERPPVLMTLDELEALRLADLDGLYQAGVAERLGVSRPTAARILAAARHAVAQAVCEDRELVVLGGTIVAADVSPPDCPVHAARRRRGRRCLCSKNFLAGRSRPDDRPSGDLTVNQNEDLTTPRGAGCAPIPSGPAALPEKETYRVAVPTNDGSTVSPHLGRSTAFVVAEIRGGAVVETRFVPVAAGRGMQHRHGACGGGGGGFGGAHGGPGAGRAHGHGDHQGILAALDGVDVVLVGGAGRRILEDLMTGGIALEAARSDTIDDTLAQFAASRA